MPVPTQNILLWSSIVTVFHVVAISTTSFRLFHRARTARMWWDDYLMAFALPINIMYFALLWVRYKLGNPSTPVDTRAAFYWMSSFSFFTLVWAARISMCLSLTRLIPAGSKWRRLTNGTAVAFAIIYVALIIQVGVICGGNQSWKQSVNVQCRGTGWGSALATDVLGDIFLMVAPLVLLWKKVIATQHRRLVFTVFGASILTALASIALHTFLLGPVTWGPGAGRVTSMLSNIEATIALTVSNLLVIVAYISHRRQKDSDIEADATEVGGTSFNPASKTVIDARGAEEDEKASQSSK